MFRILVFSEPFTLTLRMEGELNGQTISDFRRAVDDAKAQLGTRKLFADVGDLVMSGSDAEAALLQARAAGVKFFAQTGAVAAALERDEEAQCQHRCGALRRFAFFLSAVCRDSPRPFCFKLYRRLHQLA